MTVRRVPGGCLSIDYEATSERQGLQHAEHTVVTDDALLVAFSEAPGVSVFPLRTAGVFAYQGDGPYAMEIHGEFTPSGELTWAWHWASAGETPREMSRAVCRAADPWTTGA